MGSLVAKYLAIIGGVCLIIAGITGASDVEMAKSFVEDNLGIRNNILHTVFMILLLLASLGGLIVIVGGFLVGGSYARTGKFLIGLGAGIGLLGVIIAFLINWYHGNPTVYLGSGFGFFGVVLAIIAQVLA